MRGDWASSTSGWTTAKQNNENNVDTQGASAQGNPRGEIGDSVAVRYLARVNARVTSMFREIAARAFASERRWNRRHANSTMRRFIEMIAADSGTCRARWCLLRLGESINLSRVYLSSIPRRANATVPNASSRARFCNRATKTSFLS